MKIIKHTYKSALLYLLEYIQISSTCIYALARQHSDDWNLAAIQQHQWTFKSSAYSASKHDAAIDGEQEFYAGPNAGKLATEA